MHLDKSEMFICQMLLLFINKVFLLYSGIFVPFRFRSHGFKEETVQVN